MKVRMIKFAAIGLACAVAMPVSDARAEFPSRNIEFVVGYGAGGGYSDWALAIANSLPKYLPGNRKVVVRHMPGGGSVIATEYLQRAKADGHTIGIYNVFGLAATQMVNKVNYDLAQVTWLGRVSLDNEVGFVAWKNPIKTIKDLNKDKTYILSTQGLAATGTIAAAVLFERMGIKWKPLNHDKLGPAALAVMRGDADMYFGTYESTQSYVDGKELRPIIYYDDNRHPGFPDVPTPGELGMKDLDSLNPHRLVGGPPGIPADVAKLLETALRKVATEDADFKARVDQMKKTINYANAKQSAQIVNEMLANYGKYSKTVKALFDEAKKSKKK